MPWTCMRCPSRSMCYYKVRYFVPPCVYSNRFVGRDANEDASDPSASRLREDFTPTQEFVAWGGFGSLEPVSSDSSVSEIQFPALSTLR